MISPRKFNELPPDTRQRKLWRLVCELEEAWRAGDEAAGRETVNFLSAVAEQHPVLAELAAALRADSPMDIRLRAVNGLRHRLGAEIGREAAEWDLYPPAGAGFQGTPEAAPGPRRLVYLDDVRSPFNAGSIFRTASAFALDGIVLSPDCPDPRHPRFFRSAMGAVDQVPWERCGQGGAAGLRCLMERENLPCFAVELGGCGLDRFIFPPAGILVLGSEELGVHPEILELCGASAGVVTIPLPGPKASLNVGVSLGIVAEHWTADASRGG